ncbi:DUF7660 family protein [Stenotrophomonas nitritireducens]|uniref:DUF7660 family protein n=1 Tax=Stenotrophomonas nitritireducens TaxID=83617 RepID=UPI003D999116
MTSDELFDYARTVQTREDFTKFVDLLSKDFQAKKDEWENVDLESFLGGLSGFARNMGGYYKNMGDSVDIENISWRMAAEMLLAATVYGN